MYNFQKLQNREEIILEKSEESKEKYEKLNSGIYKVGDAGNIFTGTKPYFKPIPVKNELIEFKNGIMSEFLLNINEFFSERTISIYKEMKMGHKVGYIFYGKPGSGKTSLCFLAMKYLSEQRNALCFDCTGLSIKLIKYIIDEVRTIQNNPIIIFYDEFDNAVRNQEDYILPFLDGNDSIENTIFIGCTNYIDKIPKRIKDRKSRIKQCFCIDCLPFEVFKEYTESKLISESKEIINKFAFLAEEHKLTIDQLKNAIIDYKLYNSAIEDAISEAGSIVEIYETKDDD